ncbi:MAG TPA: DUF3099 domain-containing protein [Microbacteriaceae bacterium]|jgi:hypothetical protein|nr:DUF3099 domain-containing protein [Microbacteriaceae bacterium]
MKQQSITSLPQAPDAERHSRMIKYSVAMGIRVLCLVSILFVHGWWIIIPALGAVFLPYFAVVLANVGTGERGAPVLRPGNILPVRPQESRGAQDENARADQSSESHG